MTRINELDVCSFIDSGSEITIMSKKVYDMIPELRRPPLSPSTIRPSLADGSTQLHLYGEADFSISVGNNETEMHMFIADISENVILGGDYLLEAQAEIRTHSLTLGFHDCNVPLLDRRGGHLTARVSVKRDTCVPAGHEVVIAGHLSRRIAGSAWGIVEPTQGDLMTKHGVIVCRILVDTADRNVPLRLLNISDRDHVIRRGTVIAKTTGTDITDIPQPLISTVSSADNNHDIASTPVPTHLTTIYEDSVKVVGPENANKVANFLCKWENIFSKSKEDVGRTNIIKHRISTSDHSPLRQQPRRQSTWAREETTKLVKEMLEHDIIEPSHSPWAAPIILVRKSDGSTRFCVDYRRLNDITKKDAYAIPRIEDSINALAGARWFSTLDLTSGFWQVELEEDAKEKTAFTTWNGLFQWKVLPYGLCNAPATFERLMESALAGLQWEILLLYLDDIIVFASSLDQMLQRLDMVFQRLQKAGLKLKPSKCHLFQKQVEYLGHRVSADGIETSPGKVETIKTWPTPANVHEIRSFLGLASYYRRFVPNFSTIARPLTRLTEKNQPFFWDNECEYAFTVLKDHLVNAPVLAYPIPGAPLILDTDASKFGIGGVISQLDNGVERVISFASRSLSKAERNYCVTRKELLAAVHFVKHFRPYIYGQPFTLRTDHASLRWLINFKEPEGQLARWLEVLSEFDFKIVHRPGKKHQNADSLSRKPCRQCGQAHHSDVGRENDQTLMTPKLTETKLNKPDFPPSDPDPEAKAANAIGLQLCHDNETLRKLQLNDPDVGPILRLKESHDARPDWKVVSPSSSAVKAYWSSWDLLEVHNGVVYRRWVSNRGDTHRLLLILPRSLRDEIFYELHSAKTAAHFGIFKTKWKIRQRYYWYGATADIRAMIRQCDVCAARKSHGRKRRGQLQQYIVGSPLDRVALDIIGPFPTTERNNRWILVVGDYFTKWVEAYPIPNQEATTVAEKLTNEFVTRFGIPRQLHSDQGTNFESHVMSDVCRLLGIKKTRTTPYNPKSDGYVERFMRTISQSVSVLVDPDQSDWDLVVPYAMMAYRSSVQASTSETPAMLMLGREIALPTDLLHGPPPEPDQHRHTDYALQLRERLQLAHERARLSLKKSAATQKRDYDKRASGTPLEAGQFVWLHVEAFKKGTSRKLTARRWDGPYLITDKLSDVLFRIQRGKNYKPRVVHYDRLKPYTGNDGVDWRDKQQISPAGDRNDSRIRTGESDRSGPDASTHRPFPPRSSNYRRSNTFHRRLYPQRQRRQPQRFGDWSFERN